MIFGIEFQSPYFQGEQLEHLRFLPNIEEIQLSDTNVTDDDLKWLVELPKLEVIGLNGTAISNRGSRFCPSPNRCRRFRSMKRK